LVPERLSSRELNTPNSEYPWVSNSNVNRTILINHLSTQVELESASIAYFYCSRTPAKPERSDASEILRCIVKQLSWSTDGPSVRAPIFTLYESKKKDAGGREPKKLSIEESVDLMIAVLEEKPAFIVLDALDECDSSTRHVLLDALATVISKSSQLVKIAISSRDESDIRLALKDWPNLNISAQENSKDIQNYVRAEVQRAIADQRLLNGNVSKSLEAQIAKILDEHAHGM
jgi:hypothetical protein